jgi:hypothetical protein
MFFVALSFFYLDMATVASTGRPTWEEDREGRGQTDRGRASVSLPTQATLHGSESSERVTPEWWPDRYSVQQREGGAARGADGAPLHVGARPAYWSRCPDSSLPRSGTNRTAIVTYLFDGNHSSFFHELHADLHYTVGVETTGAPKTLNFTDAALVIACLARTLAPPDVDIVVLVLPTVPDTVRTALAQAGAIVVPVEPLPYLDQRTQAGLRTGARVRALMFSKSWAFTLVQYRALLFLDADALLFRYPPSLFDGTYVPPDPWTLSVAKGYNGAAPIQAGVMLLRPSAQVWGELLLFLTWGSYGDGNAAAWGVLGDQALLSDFFPPDRRQQLPISLNCRNCKDVGLDRSMARSPTEELLDPSQAPEWKPAPGEERPGKGGLNFVFHSHYWFEQHQKKPPTTLVRAVRGVLEGGGTCFPRRDVWQLSEMWDPQGNPTAAAQREMETDYACAW